MSDTCKEVTTVTTEIPCEKPEGHDGWHGGTNPQGSYVAFGTWPQPSEEEE